MSNANAKFWISAIDGEKVIYQLKQDDLTPEQWQEYQRDCVTLVRMMGTHRLVPPAAGVGKMDESMNMEALSAVDYDLSRSDSALKKLGVTREEFKHHIENFDITKLNDDAEGRPLEPHMQIMYEEYKDSFPDTFHRANDLHNPFSKLFQTEEPVRVDINDQERRIVADHGVKEMRASVKRLSQILDIVRRCPELFVVATRVVDQLNSPYHDLNSPFGTIDPKELPEDVAMEFGIAAMALRSGVPVYADREGIRFYIKSSIEHDGKFVVSAPDIDVPEHAYMIEDLSVYYDYLRRTYWHG